MGFIHGYQLVLGWREAVFPKIEPGKYEADFYRLGQFIVGTRRSCKQCSGIAQQGLSHLTRGSLLCRRLSLPLKVAEPSRFRAAFLKTVHSWSTSGLMQLNQAQLGSKADSGTERCYVLKQ